MENTGTGRTGSPHSLMRWIKCSLLLLVASAILPGQFVESSLFVPTGLNASDGDYSTKVGVSWDHSQGAATYRIFRGTENDAASAVSIGTTASLIFFDTTALPEQSYHYWVRAETANATRPVSAPDQGFRANGRTSQFDPVPPLAPPRDPIGNPTTGAKIYLGKTLFWEEQLSSTRTVACGTCHRGRSGGSDPRSDVGASVNPGFDGIFGTDDDVMGSLGVPLNRADGTYEWSPLFGLRPQVTGRKAQSAINAAYSVSSDAGLLWDGKASHRFSDPMTGAVVIETGAALESQALLPILNTTEMNHEGATWADVVMRLSESRPLALSPSLPPALSAWIGSRGYPDLFTEAFGTPEVTPVRIALAIASYERTLYSDRTPFDAAVSEIIEESPAEKRGREVFFAARCHKCHTGSVTSDQSFRNIGLRPSEEDGGRAEVTGLASETGRFRTPSLRNVGLRSPYMHNGRLATLEEVVEFYNRGGDFDDNKDVGFISPLGLTAEEKSDLVVFLKNQFTDSRVEAEAGPLFDRPMLYSESARVPEISGTGTAGAGGVVPQVVAIEPPFSGNPSFTVGLFDAPPGVQAVLVIDEADPGMGPAIPSSASFARETVAVAAAEDGSGNGYASASLSIPDDASLIGTELFGRWFVLDGAAAGGVSVTAAFRMTIFGAEAPTVSVLSSVSAASLAQGFVAPESIVSGFGVDLATATEAAGSMPLPTTLAGVSVAVTDSQGEQRPASLFFVSPKQINYQIPPGTSLGEGEVSVHRGPNPFASIMLAGGNVQVASVAPALFAANSDGRGVAAALVQRVRSDGSQTFEQVAQFDSAQDRFVSAPINLGPESDPVFLILFGTGIRFRGPQEVTATVGGDTVEVLFAGAQPEFVGVDQVNLHLSRNLAGRGEVDVIVTVDGQPTNTVQISVF